MSLLQALAAGKAHVNAPRLGIACSLTGSLFIVLNDAAMKGVAKGIPVGELIAIRAFTVLTLVSLYLVFSGQAYELRVRHAKAQALRAGMMVAGSFMYVAAIRSMPLADAAALLFVAPILMTAMAPALLGEAVEWQRWSAVVIGFLGVVVMLRPSGNGLYWIALLPVASAFTSALRDLITRRISAHDSTFATLFYSTLAVFIVSAATLPLGWTWPAAFDWGLLLLGGVVQLAAHFFMIETFRFIEVSAVAPLKYVGLVFATAAGYFFFGEAPDEWTIVGATFIVAGGLYIVYRARRLRLPTVEP
ncbi:MAG: DMT family transporter [Alphaproteobacteria bacterium]|nr:DMT family transporter [Alphaproteobacteria bacterium]